MTIQYAKEVHAMLTIAPLTSPQVIMEKLQAKYPDENVKKSTVWTTYKRWYDKNAELIKAARENIEALEDDEDVKDGIAPVFKEMVKYAQWSERQGYPVTTNMILSFFKETHKLGANEKDIIRQEKLVAEVCQKIYEFSDSLEWDPKIEDDEWLEDGER